MNTSEDKNAHIIGNDDSNQSFNSRKIRGQRRTTTGGDTASDQFSCDLGDDENWHPDGYDPLKKSKTPITWEE